VPYLNGGLFDVHQLEQRYSDIQIADEAFEHIFAFFNEFDWHLDDRPLRNDREINPDVLGYIFEKYINQKQMGAYYTKEDITGYISKNTIVPRLLEETEQNCLIAFAPDGFVWSLLRRDPDRYIYEAVKHGCDLPLPSEIEVGIHDVRQRGEWNKPAPEAYALPTETWREIVARRLRYEEVKAKLVSGAMISVNDLITYNLDICQFAEDSIAYSEGVDLLNAVYASLETITILDPTCGSGAFLFAALNILEPLYEACLDRMQEMVAERDRLDALETQQRVAYLGSYIPRFRDILVQVAKHPNRRYFILKSIIINNLYGVDIMEEAVEICKLRLFLKLVAQIGRFQDIEPLPDIDFNIRAGNTLVGFATYAEAEQAITSKWDFDNAMARIEQKALEVEQAFHNFRTMQTAINVESEQMAEMKQLVRSLLSALNEELDRYLAGRYGIDRTNILNKAEYEERFKQWRQSHQPFHWFVEFYGILQRGGFDVIIGNPPYVEYKDIKKIYTVQGFETLSCGDLYSYVVECAYKLAIEQGKIGMIIPISIFGTDGFASLQRLSMRTLDSLWISCFANRPAQLFDGAQKRLTILIGRKGVTNHPALYTTTYLRWAKEERSHLFAVRMQYSARETSFLVFPASLEKLGSAVEVSVFSRLLKVNERLGAGMHESTAGKYPVYYTRKFGYFLAFLDFIPRLIDIKTNSLRPPSELKMLSLNSPAAALITIASLSSTTFFWFWNVLSDCRNLNRRDLLAFPLNPERLSTEEQVTLNDLAEKYLQTLRATSRMMLKSGLHIETFEYASCKPIIDEIDRELARHYGFTEEELDFIINYDIKYRVGQANGDEEEE